MNKLRFDEGINTRKTGKQTQLLKTIEYYQLSQRKARKI